MNWAPGDARGIFPCQGMWGGSRLSALREAGANDPLRKYTRWERGLFQEESMPNTPTKCAHMACTCMAPTGKKYCSMHCEDAKSMTTLTCHCGHHGCDEKA